MLAEWARLDDAITAQVAVCERQERRLRSEAAVAPSASSFCTACRPERVFVRSRPVPAISPTSASASKRRRREIAKVERTPVPSDDIADRVKRHVDGLAAKAHADHHRHREWSGVAVLFPLHENADRVALSGFAPTKATRCCWRLAGARTL